MTSITHNIDDIIKQLNIIEKTVLPQAAKAAMKRAWTQIKDDVDKTGIDRLELLAWSIQTLMSAAGQAKQQKNPGAVVACIKQLDWMTGLGINSTSGQRGHRGHR